ALAETGVEMLGAYIAGHEATIRQKVAEQSPRWLPRWIDRMLADKVSEGLLKTVREMRDPGHPWREELRQAVEGFIERLGADPRLRAEVEALKLRLLDDPRLQRQIAELWAGLEARIGQELAADGGELSRQLQ